MSKFSEAFLKWEKKFWEEQDKKTFVSHSTSYHNYFQGYSERKVIKPGSLTYSIERVYTAHYLAYADTKRRWIAFKLLYAALFLAACGFTAAALFSRSPANDAGWVAVFGVLQALMLVLTIIPVGNYVVAPMKMKLGEYYIGAGRMERYLRAALWPSGAYLLTQLVFYLVRRTSPGAAGLCCIAAELLALGAIAALYVTENRMPYRRIENENKQDYNSNEIW